VSSELRPAANALVGVTSFTALDRVVTPEARRACSRFAPPAQVPHPVKAPASRTQSKRFAQFRAASKSRSVSSAASLLPLCAARTGPPPHQSAGKPDTVQTLRAVRSGLEAAKRFECGELAPALRRQHRSPTPSKRRQAGRSPYASRSPKRPRSREASGVRRACSRFPPPAAVSDPIKAPARRTQSKRFAQS